MPPKKKTKPRKPAAMPKAPRRKAPKAKANAAAKAAAPAVAPAKPKEQVAIAKAKGRPMLSWVGKRPLRAATAFPAQLVETFSPKGADKVPVADATIWKDWPAQYPKGGLLFHGDNKEVLAHLLANGFRGKVQLIYIDPPFDSGADYVRKVSLRGPAGTTKLDGETYSLGEQIQYTDIWANDNYLQFMYERLLMMKELLAEEGTIYLQCDWHKAHHLRCLLDEVFGEDNFVNQIVWKRGHAHSDSAQGSAHYGRLHEVIFYCVKGGQSTFNQQYTPYTQEYIDRYYKFVEKGTGRRYWLDNIQGPGGGAKGNPFYEIMGVSRYWRYSKEKMEKLIAEGRIIQTAPGTVPKFKRYLDEMSGRPVQDVWDDIQSLAGMGASEIERLDYPTQKPEELLARIIQTSSKPVDIVLDCFIGSGTTAAVAQKLGRRWIGCDINKGAVQTTATRLHSVMAEQITAGKKTGKQMELLAGEGTEEITPAQLSLTAHRVNDYDLAIQHNEAVNLACEHIGVTRTLGDSFFDGTLGNKKLVKIVPFGHSLSPADLEEVKTELGTRAKETRDVVVVCLGKEMAVDPWLAEWNRMRKQGDTPNKIEVIELRSDPKYGKFIKHKPAAARVDIRREKAKGGDKILVEITDFISPSIVERLQDAGGVLAPKIPEWRAMVDSVMIDPAHDGKVFNIALADVPARKQDYVQGKYELPAPAAKTTVAVKVTDMLGEEVVTVKEI